MPIQEFDEPGLGTRLGTALGKGLSTGIERLISDKLKDIQSERLEKSGLPGVLAYLDPQTQAAYLKQYGAAQQLSAQQERAAQMQEQIAEAELGRKEFQQDAPELDQSFKEKSPEEQANLASEPHLDETSTITSAKMARPTPEQLSREAQLSTAIDNLRNKLADPTTPRNLKVGIQKRIDEKEKQLQKISDRLEDKTAAVRSEVTKNYKNSKDVLDVLKRQQELNEAGHFQTAGDLAFLQGLGIEDIDSLKHPDLQEFIKNNGVFYRQLKGLFGGRITNSEIDLFRRTIANEFQSPEGRRRVIESLRKAAKGDVVRFKTMRDLIDNNKGMPPERLEELIEIKSKKDLRKIKKEWLEELKKTPLPEAESKFVTGVKAIGGKALGGIGRGIQRAAVPALTGAAVGSLASGIGAVPGAIGGGLLGLSGLLRGPK